MLNLNSLMIGTHNPRELAAFYEKIFGKPADMVEGDWHGWQIGGCFLSIGEHSEISGQNPQPARIMFNFETTSVKEDFERMKSLGATVIKEPYEMTEGDDGWIATLADPDGNYFQLMPPWDNK